MTSRLARTVANLAVKVAPPERRAWAEAARAELGHLPEDASATAFAVGGLQTALGMRLASPAFVLSAARWGLAAAASVWATLHLWLAGRLDDAGAPLPYGLSYVAAGVYGLGAVITAVFGPRVAAWLVAPVLAIAVVYAAGAATLLTQSPNRAFHQALALEEVAALLIAMLVALGASRYADQRAAR